MPKSLDNSFGDPRHSNVENLVSKADMSNIIRSTMKRRNWSVQDVAEKTGLDPLLVEKIYVYRLKDYSIDEIKLVFDVICEVT